MRIKPGFRFTVGFILAAICLNLVRIVIELGQHDLRHASYIGFITVFWVLILWMCHEEWLIGPVRGPRWWCSRWWCRLFHGRGHENYWTEHSKRFFRCTRCGAHYARSRE